MSGRPGIASRTAMFGGRYKMRGQVPSYSPEHGLLQSILQQACYHQRLYFDTPARAIAVRPNRGIKGYDSDPNQENHHVGAS